MKVTDDIKRAQQQAKSAYDMMMKETQATRDYIEKVSLDAQKVVQDAVADRIKATTSAKQTEDALQFLGENGWYIDFDMSASATSVFATKEFTEKDLDVSLSEYFTSKLGEIEESIVAKHPRRHSIISAAFKAHRNGDYELSIPVLLTQIDGIGFETLGHSFFKRKDGIPKTTKFVEERIGESLYKGLLYPLAEDLEISRSWDDTEVDFDLLNRHMILHGRNVVYGTRLNSLKVISFMNYVVQALEKK